MRPALAVLLLAGCDGVFGLDEIPPDAPPPTCFHDGFDGELSDLFTNWDRYASGPTAIAVVKNGTLAIEIQASSNDWAGVTSRGSYDLRGRRVTIGAAPVLLAPATGESYLFARIDSTNYYGFVANSSFLSFLMRIDGINASLTTIPYDSAAHAYWQIAHDGTSVVFSTSPNGIDWIARHSVEPTLPVEALTVLIGASSANGGPTTALDAVYDDLKICPP